MQKLPMPKAPMPNLVVRKFYLIATALSLMLSAQAISSERQLLMEVTFPPQYGYAPHFDAALVRQSLAEWRDKRLLLIGSGDPGTTSQTGAVSVAESQLRKSDALRLAHRRAQWLRKELLALGFSRDNLQIGTSLGTSAEAEGKWGGFVKIYALN